MKKNNKGVTLWELMLFTLLLAVAGGASVFFFFINSADVQKAHNQHVWITEINKTLDAITLEIANSVAVEHPFVGSSPDCYFRAARGDGSLIPAASQEGFAFSDNSLVYVSRGGTEAPLDGAFSRLDNPIVANCSRGRFIRTGPNRLELRFVATSPDDRSISREFYRVIYLRNQ